MWGGGNKDYITAIQTNGDNLYATGYSDSYDFPGRFEASQESKDIFLLRFNPDEKPLTDDPTPSPVLAGHWQSAESLYPYGNIPGHLDVNICGNGEFSGFWGIYDCVPDPMNLWFCTWQSDRKGEAVSGRIDFSKDEGFIDFESSPGVSFTITSKSVEQLVIRLHTSESWDLGEDVLSILYYQGDDGEHCGAAGSDSADSGDGNGGGGGGCFVTTTSPLNLRWD